MPKSGEVRSELQTNPRSPPAEAYRMVELGRDALGYYIVSDSSAKPYRTKIGRDYYVYKDKLYQVLYCK